MLTAPTVRSRPWRTPAVLRPSRSPAKTCPLGGSIVSLSSGATFTTASDAAGLLTTIDDSITQVSASLAKLGTSSKALENHLTFVGKLQDSLTAGIGNLVDADMAKEKRQIASLANQAAARHPGPVHRQPVDLDCPEPIPLTRTGTDVSPRSRPQLRLDGGSHS
ncbi:MAG: flagellin [Asticcacaulis sp.]